MASVVVTLAILVGGLVLMITARQRVASSGDQLARWCLRGALLAGVIGLVGTGAMLFRAFGAVNEASAEHKQELLASSISGALTFTYAGITGALVLAAASLLFSRRSSPAGSSGSGES